MDSVPDPLLLRISGSAGNRTRDLCICSQKLWPLDHRGGRNNMNNIINDKWQQTFWFDIPYIRTVTLCGSIRKLYVILAVNVLIWTFCSVTARMISASVTFHEIVSALKVYWEALHSSSPLTSRHRASCILGQAFHYSPENAFYIFNQQIYFIIWYLLDRASLI